MSEQPLTKHGYLIDVKTGGIICPSCKGITSWSYATTPNTKCWSCGSNLSRLPGRNDEPAIAQGAEQFARATTAERCVAIVEAEAKRWTAEDPLAPVNTFAGALRALADAIRKEFNIVKSK